jgi:hypothetical protein
MEADFSGYATKAGLRCTDGRTILPNAFEHQDKLKVPLVWQHGHSDPENVLGHAILENRPDGVYCYAYFNDSAKAQHAKGLVIHKDITQMSIWANELIEHSKRVLHGAIREVSLVLAGANPGALIDWVRIAHADGSESEMDGEAVITTGIDFELFHADGSDETEVDETEVDETEVDETEVDETEVDETEVDEADGEIQHAADGEGPTIQEVYDTLDDEQQQLVHYMIGEAIKSAKEEAAVEHSNMIQNQEGTDAMHNVFDNNGKTKNPNEYELSHDDVKEIVTSATMNGSFKQAVSEFALSHGINEIDILFPDAKSIDSVPEWIKRRTEWVGTFLGATRKNPFSRIRTFSADLTHEDARAKGYVKGSLKREEFFGVMKRVTTPTTVYKKQKLDRDDIVDITDFDVVAWLKAEMRIMLDEEIARAALIGDGRDVSHEDKINEGNIRPIANDHELYTTQVYVNLNDASSSIQEFVDEFIKNRKHYRGSGLPTFYTTETYIAQFLMLKDQVGRRVYKSLDELAAELRVQTIVPVEALEDEPDIIGIAVNPADYVFGATAGGEVNMFDDFDIDYNQQKYLIETRLSGALTKVKSALCFRKVAGTDVLVVPGVPAFNPATGALTITNQTGVVYKNGAGVVINAAGSPYTVASGDTYTVVATPASGYYFATSNDDEWDFTAD